jgi:predicted nuclease with TOPRIM domain
MPELYGQPFKSQLRNEISQLKTELSNEHKKHQQIRRSLRYANAKIEALEAKIARMEQKGREVLEEAARDIARDTSERYWDHRRSLAELQSQVDVPQTSPLSS